MQAEANQICGDYRLIEPLGRGGMGEVWLAEHVHLRKRYALKLLPAEIAADPTFVTRFHTEARVMADLDHPRIVRVHNFGLAGSTYFLVMDYIEGPGGKPQSLDERVRAAGGRLPESEVRRILLQICEGLAYAHGFGKNGVIHRDLKPANILIDQAGNAHIADFGLVKVVGEDFVRSRVADSLAQSIGDQPTNGGTPESDRSIGSEPTARPDRIGYRTSTGALLGTYDFMSPEQRKGHPVDSRSDIYALGVIAYMLLIGEKPEGRFPMPSKAVPGLSSKWDRVIDQCLQIKPENRPQSVDEAARMIRSTHRRPFAAAAMIALPIIILAVLGVWLSRPGSPTPASEQTKLAVAPTPMPTPAPSPAPTIKPSPTPTPSPTSPSPIRLSWEKAPIDGARVRDPKLSLKWRVENQTIAEGFLVGLDDPDPKLKLTDVSKTFELAEPGEHTVTVIPLGHGGTRGEPLSVHFTYQPNRPPVLSANLDKTEIEESQTARLIASAIDPDGDVTRLEMRVDGGDWLLLTQGTTTLSKLVVQSHDIEVKALDSEGFESKIWSASLNVYSKTPEPLLKSSISPTEWISNPQNGHEYKLTDPNLSWAEAEAQAVKHQGHLVTINDSAEQDWIYSTFANPVLAQTSRQKRIWIGFSDAMNEGHWIWRSGEGGYWEAANNSGTSYTHWAVGSPNNNGNEDYALMIWPDWNETKGGWDDGRDSPGNRCYGLIERVIQTKHVQSQYRSYQTRNINYQENKPYTFPRERTDRGAVQNGIITQSDLISTFGRPNTSTTDAAGVTSWVYDWTLGKPVRPGGEPADAATINKLASYFGESTAGKTNVTVIIKFNSDNTVRDYSVHSH